MNADRLKCLIEYNSDSGEFTHRIAKGSCKAGSKAGCLNAIGYIRICVDGKDYSGHRLAWLYHYGDWPPGQVDHINGVRSDKRISNLRLADNSKNNMNKSIQSNNTSGYKGVSLHKQSGLWFAYAQAEGKRYSAGYHKTPEEAYQASCVLRELLHKQFARHDYRRQEEGK